MENVILSEEKSTSMGTLSYAYLLCKHQNSVEYLELLGDIHVCSISQLVLENERFFKPNKLLFGVLQISHFLYNSKLTTNFSLNFENIWYEIVGLSNLILKNISVLCLKILKKNCLRTRKTFTDKFPQAVVTVFFEDK